MTENNKNDHHHSELGHIVPYKTYLTVFISLIILTVITVVVAKVEFFNFGEVLNLALALFIASIKAGLVALFFMHLKYENPLTWLYAFFPIFLLFLLIGGVFIDNPLR